MGPTAGGNPAVSPARPRLPATTLSSTGTAPANTWKETTMTGPSPASLTATSLVTARNNLPWVPTLTARRRRALDARLARHHATRTSNAAHA